MLGVCLGFENNLFFRVYPELLHGEDALAFRHPDQPEGSLMPFGNIDNMPGFDSDPFREEILSSP